MCCSTTAARAWRRCCRGGLPWLCQPPSSFLFWSTACSPCPCISSPTRQAAAMAAACVPAGVCLLAVSCPLAAAWSVSMLLLLPIAWTITRLPATFSAPPRPACLQRNLWSALPNQSADDRMSNQRSFALTNIVSLAGELVPAGTLPCRLPAFPAGFQPSPRAMHASQRTSSSFLRTNSCAWLPPCRLRGGGDGGALHLAAPQASGRHSRWAAPPACSRCPGDLPGATGRDDPLLALVALPPCCPAALKPSRS
jgi:hypothetical protein